ncbi:MAG: hypothetical protein JNJ50_09740 [Acidobacteria bacterium]|nr:hypothetical protein [Acidobacteriota bacterium]
MKQTAEQLEKIRQYLLGALPEPEQTALENEYLNDDERFEQMLAVETELVDGYVRGTLTGRDLQQFEAHYLAHPDRRARTRFAQALHNKLNQQAAALAERPAQQISWWQKLQDLVQLGNLQLGLASAAALLLLSIGIGAFFLLRRDETDTQYTAVTETPSPLPSVVVQPSVQPTPASPSPSVPEKPRTVFASLVLVAGGLRSETQTTTPRLSLAPEVDYARLQVKIRRQGYPSYRASLSFGAGAEVWQKQGLKSNVRDAEEVITLTIPASQLAAGDYILTLRGVTKAGEVEDVSKSSFQIERK